MKGLHIRACTLDVAHLTKCWLHNALSALRWARMCASLVELALHTRGSERPINASCSWMGGCPDRQLRGVLDRPQAAARRHASARLEALGGDVHGELAEAVGVAPLVVVPGDELEELVREADARARVEDGRARVALEVGGDDLVLGVADDALV